MIPPIVVHVGLGALLVLTAVPLILRRVPRNRFFGIRLPSALESDARWYAINAYGGKILLVYGLLLAAFGVFASPYAPGRTSPWMAVFIVGPLLAFLPALALVRSFADRLR